VGLGARRREIANRDGVATDPRGRFREGIERRDDGDAAGAAGRRVPSAESRPLAAITTAKPTDTTTSATAARVRGLASTPGSSAEN
jgi:hypothetical protein